MWQNTKFLNHLTQLCLLLTLLIATYAAFIWLSNNVHLPIKTIEITGNVKYTLRSDIQSISDQHLRGDFFSLDIREIGEAFSILPWVETAEVHRKWSDTLVVNLSEYMPVAYVNRRGSDERNNNQFLASNGVIFGVDRIELDLPVVQFDLGTERGLTQRYAALIQSFSRIMDVGGLEVDSFTIESWESWKIQLKDSTMIYLGSSKDKDLVPRLERFVGLWVNRLRFIPYKIERVDLRYPNGIALKMKDFKKGVSTLPRVVTEGRD